MTETPTGDERIPFPIKWDAVSNGEFVPLPQSELVLEAQRRTLEHIEREARRRGLDRRVFLKGLTGSATMLAMLAACSKESKSSSTSRATTSGATTSTEPAGTFTVPSDATTSTTAAADALTGDEFIFDVQTHLLETGGGGVGEAISSFALGFPYSNCGDDEALDCFRTDHWMEEIFGRSDTSVAIISAIPIVVEPNPLSIEVMAEAKRAAERVCGDGRVLMHGQANPNVGDVAVTIDGMRSLVDEYAIAAWKVYTHIPGNRPWYLDDHDTDAVQCGHAFLDAVMEIGPRIVCVHKGFGGLEGSGAADYASPIDIGPAARAYPEINFIVYHSGYESGGREGPFEVRPTADFSYVGVDRFISTLREHDLGPGGNVYAELGSTWRAIMQDPDTAGHVVGKLLNQLGPERICWGTDSIWYGTPQDQIEAFRTFQITESARAEHGYPELDDVAKRRILGYNSASVYGVDPLPVCRKSAADIEAARRATPPSMPVGPRDRRELAALLNAHAGLP
jgi:predicted TIM-barrel fold metal-dependent hydrolase